MHNLTKKLTKYTLLLAVLMIFSSQNGYSQSELDEGYDQLNQGNYDAAAEIFEDYLLSNPDDTKIYLHLAYIYKTQNETE